MKKLLILFVLVGHALAACTTGGSGNCEVGSGKTYSTVASCLSAMSAGQTCQVFGSSVFYNENVTITAGTAGNLKSLIANPGDSVYIDGVTLNSYTKVNGFFIQNGVTPTTTTAGDCVSVTGGSTNFFITNNTIFGCGGHWIKEPSGSNSTYGYIQGNTMSYPCWIPAMGAPTSSSGVCTGMYINGDYQLIENNTMSHMSDGPYLNGRHLYVRKNTSGPVITSDCATSTSGPSSNCHVDFMQADTSGGPPGGPIQYVLLENNTVTNWTVSGGPGGAGVHSIGLFQEDACGGNCGFGIVRFHKVSHFDGGGLFDDTNNWANLKTYNNSYVDVARQLNSTGSLFNTFFWSGGAVTGASAINNIFYFTVPLSGYAADSFNSASASTGTWGHSLAFCTSTGCSSIYSHIYNSGTFSSDTGNILGSDPLFVTYSGNNFNLQSGSPARNSGTNLTTANGSGVASTTLTLTDETYFQDANGGMTGVQPDCISITTVSNHVCIVAGSINNSAHQVTLASPMTWSSGAPIYLYSISDGTVVQTDTSVDMGAFPFSGIIPLVGCGLIFYGPPNYPCGSPSTTNPGQVSFYFQGKNPQALVNTSNAAISPCTANCLQYAGTGDQFNTGWQTGVGAGNGGNILLGGGVGTVNTSSTSVTWVSGTVFNTAWSGTMTIAGVARTISSCASTTACTLTTSAGTLTGAGYSVKGTPFGVAAWNSATVATLMSAPGTQTSVTMLDHTACIPITALDHTPSVGCQNAVSHDPTLPGYVAGSNLITQIADQGSSVNGLPVGNLTPSGGDNDRIWSKPNETYLWIVNSGGSAQPMQLSTASGYVQVVNSSTACPGYVPPSIPSAMSTGWLSDTRYYYAANGTQIFQGDLTGTGCTLAIQASPTMLVDVEAAGVCPGIPSGLTLSGIMGVGGNGSGTILDDTFTMGLNYAGGQGHGDWIVSWSRTRGCWTANLHTGQVWAFCTSSCTSSTPALGTMATGSTNCWGLDGSTGNGTHDQQTDGLGIYVFVSSDDSNGYTAGGCTGTTEALIQLQIGTLNNFWTDSVTLGGNKVIGNHQMVGITNIVSNAFAAMTYSPMNNLPAYVTYANFPLSNGAPVHDIHQGLVEECTGLGSYSDSPCPIIGNTDTVLSTQLSGCTGSGAFVAAVYCPTAYSNMLTVMFPFGGFPSPLLTFAHTGSCGGISNGCADQIPSGFGDIDSIGVPSPKGDIFCWSSTMWHQLGYDRNAAPADEAFCMYFGQPKLAIAPATGLFAHVTKNFNAHFPISGGSK